MNPIDPKKIEAMVLCGAFGDSLGIPVEMRTKPEIVQILKQEGIHGDKVHNFLSPTYHKLYKEGPYDQSAQVISSDDTYCSRAIMRSLHNRGIIDWHDMMEQKLHFYNVTDFGYGGTTREAYTNFENSGDISQIGNPGWGNGVIMKLAPLSAYLCSKNYSPKETYDTLSTFTNMTHTHESVSLGTMIHHTFLEFLLSHSNLTNISEVFEKMIKISHEHENSNTDIPLSPILKMIRELYNSRELQTMTDEDILNRFGWGDEKITSYSGRIDITLGICYAVFLRNATLGGIVDAVSIGGDTDTYGAIVGNMTGALTGEKPDKKALSQLPDIQDIQEEISNFVEICNS